MKLRKIKLKWKIFFVLAGLIAIILLLLWLFQVFFWDEFYHSGRKNAVRAAAEEVAENLDLRTDESEFQIFLNRICLKYDVCLVVLEGNGEKHKGGSSLYSTLLSQTADSLSALARRAENAGGRYTEELTLSELGNDWVDEAVDDVSSVTYALIPDDAYGVRLVVAEVIIAPADSFSYASTVQNLIFSLFVVLSAGVATLVMSQMIAKPIEALNLTAKDLAKGKPDLQFKAEGYLEIEQLSDSLNYAAKEISEAEHYRKELLANVSHDLKTPLALIKGYSEMMRDLPGETTPENLQVIIDETERLTGLVNDLLEVSRLQSGDDFTPEVFVLNDAIAEIVARVGALLQGKITVRYEQEGRFAVNADKKKIDQVVYNLISNAVNYVGEDNLVEICVKKHNKLVRVEVKDNGEGIDVEVLPRIWDRYYKSDKAHKRAVVGTGLGLSIVKHVVAMHPGGVYGVQTTRGHGSVFYFELPIVESPHS